MKRKILAIALVACMAIVAIAGASLAYFTDKDEATNIFTSGKVDITLNEVFDADTAQLIPGLDIQKDVTISLSSDSVDTYVWYTYAIPAELAGIVHVNHAGRNLVDYREDTAYWTADQTAATPLDRCWILDNKIVDTITVDGIEYHVYAVLYNGVLEAGDETTVGMTKVYCDTKVDFDNESGEYVINGQPIGFDLNEVKIIVTAYGIQAATFSSVQDAYAAYAAQSAEVAGIAVDID